MHFWFIDLIDYTHESVNAECKDEVDRIYCQYIANIKLINPTMRLLYIGIILCLNAWVWAQGNVFESVAILYCAYVAFIFISAVAAYSVILLLSINSGMMDLIKNCNCYKVPYTTTYADFIRKILAINSRITKIITVIYILLWIGLINGPFTNLNISIFIIMFGIGLLPLMYTFYNIQLKAMIIKISLGSDIKNFEETHLEPLYKKIKLNPNESDIAEYYKLSEFRDYLIASKKKEKISLKFDIILSALTALVPVAW